MNLVFVASHLGYPMDRTPLGGGAMVGLQLVRHWEREPGLRVVALGSGPQAPSERAEYARLAAAPEGLVGLSELAYARFCRRFERETTDWVLGNRGRLPPESTVVLVNDISEGPDLAALRGAGYPIVSIWHVDVVDYFNRMYLGNRLAPETLARRLSGPVARRLPDVLRLVFEKQELTVRHSARMLVPSSAMAETIGRCYGDASRCRVIPWGAWDDGVAPADAARRAEELRAHWQIGPETRVIATLSRISPEKGIHRLLEAMALLETRVPGDLCALIAGEPAFMQGRAYMRRVRAAAARLRRARVFFPGYLPPLDKRALFGVAELFVSPSLHESYGLNVVEALRGGLPVLASAHYGVRDMIRPEYGRVVEIGRESEAPEAFAGELQALLSNPARLRAMGRRAREAAERMRFPDAASAVLAEARALVRAPEAVAG